MQVLGDLIDITPDPSETSRSLPLPWWHRSPLGFLHRTKIFVALVDSGRPVGNLIVSVLDPTNWERIVRIQCRRDDKRGVLATVFQSVQPLNIALAEAATIEIGGKHDVTLLCEPVGGQDVQSVIPDIRQRLKDGEFENISVDRYFDKFPKVLCQDVGEVHHGWVHHCGWYAQMLERYHKFSASAG